MVGKVPCLLKMRCQLKNRNSRKNYRGKWSEKSLFKMLGICNFLCILEIFLGCVSLSYAKRSVLEAWHLKNTIKITKIQRFTTFKVWGFFRLLTAKIFPTVALFCWQHIFNRHGTFPTIKLMRSGKNISFGLSEISVEEGY